MKTLRIFSSLIILALLAIAGCSKDEALVETGPTMIDPAPLINPAVFLDNFNKESLTTNWISYGAPSPFWVDAAYGREGLLCLNGNTPDYSYCVSKSTIGAGWGYVIESELGILEIDPSQREVAVGVAVSYDKNPVYMGGNIATGIEMKLAFYGSSVFWAPGNLIGHAWLSMKYIDSKGNTISNMVSNNVDYLIGDWHTMKIIVNQNRTIQFYCDGMLVWAPQNAVQYNLMSQRKLLAGFASPLSSGLAFHNYIKCTYPQPNSTPE